VIRRILQIRRLRPDRIDEYIRRHDDIWSELVAEHRRAGTRAISSFLDDTDLYVYFEYDAEIADRFGRDELPARRRWQEWMATVQASEEVRILPEVFRMEIRDSQT
jgi:L-rhamnose mutarotase